MDFRCSRLIPETHRLKPVLPNQKSFLAGSICFEIAADTVKIGSFTTWLNRRFIATLHKRYA